MKKCGQCKSTGEPHTPSPISYPALGFIRRILKMKILKIHGSTLFARGAARLAPGTPWLLSDQLRVDTADAAAHKSTAVLRHRTSNGHKNKITRNPEYWLALTDGPMCPDTWPRRTHKTHKTQTFHAVMGMCSHYVHISHTVTYQPPKRRRGDYVRSFIQHTIVFSQPEQRAMECGTISHH